MHLVTHRAWPDLSALDTVRVHAVARPWGKHMLGEVLLRRYDGMELPVSQVVVAHKLMDGTVDYLSCISRDISERREFEAALVYQGAWDRRGGRGGARQWGGAGAGR